MLLPFQTVVWLLLLFLIRKEKIVFYKKIIKFSLDLIDERRIKKQVNEIMRKFEYKLLTINVNHLKKEKFQIELDEKFQKWGNEGWELIKMESITSGGMFFHGATTESFFAVFKREKL